MPPVVAPDVYARVHFRPTDKGGRNGPTPPNFLRCPFYFEGEFFDVQIDLEKTGNVRPGDTVDVPMTFFCPELVKPRLKVGSEFALWEGHFIAEGSVTKIL